MRRAPFPYEVFAVTVEQGKFRGPIAGVREDVERLGVEWIVVDDPTTLGLVRDGVLHGCDVCSRNRRRTLYRTAAEHAGEHHRDRHYARGPRDAGLFRWCRFGLRGSLDRPFG